MNKITKFIKSNKLTKIAALTFFALFFVFIGYILGHANLVFENNFQAKIVNRELAKPRSVDFSLFWAAYNEISTKYSGKIDTQKLVYGAISGMVDSLDDPYSVFMDPNLSKSFAQDLSGEFEGIGAELSVVDGKLVVVSPLSGYPAEKAGIKPADQILKINDTPTDNLTIYGAIALIRGKAGTKVNLTVVRTGSIVPQVIEITRQKITVKSVEWNMKEGNVAYVKVGQFGDDTTRLMAEAATNIAVKNPKAIILDLRSNPGGYLQSAVDMVSLFTPKGSVVVKEKNKDGSINEEKTNVDPVITKTKLIVLINKGSASASEITAGALQDYGLATLVGEKSFGKGCVQEMIDLAGGASLKLTVADWLTPKDRVINKIGIEPDVKVILTEDDYKAGRDPQLDKAMELVK